APAEEEAAVALQHAKPGAAAVSSPSAAEAAAAAPAPASTPLLERLHEIERAEEAQALLRHQLQPAPASQQQQQPQQPLSVEDIIANAPIPDRAKSWLREHSEYVTDPQLNAKMQECHHVAKWQSGSEFTDDYFDRMEDLLGLQQPAANDATSDEVPRMDGP